MISVRCNRRDGIYRRGAYTIAAIRVSELRRLSSVTLKSKAISKLSGLRDFVM